MDKGVSLQVVKTPRFKTNLVGVFIQRPLTKREATLNTLISMVLNKGSEKYTSYEALNKKLEELYGSVIVADVVKKGDRQVLSIKLQMLNQKYVDEIDMFEEGLKVLSDVMFHPLTVDGGFKKSIFDQEVSNLEDRIKGRINDKVKYAIDRCIEEMCKDQVFSVYEYGDMDILRSITPQDLMDHYKNIFKDSIIDIYVLGDVEEDRTESLIREHIAFDREGLIEIKDEPVIKHVNDIIYKEEKFNVNQGKLSLGFRTNVPYTDRLYEGSVLFSTILGGGPNSKLFKNIREKESLCYYIFSRVEKFMAIMLISCGIEFDKYEKTKKLVLKEVDAVKAGDFTDEDILIAKKAILTSIKSLTDNANSLMDYLFSQRISGNNDGIEVTLNKIDGVKRQDILDAGKSLELEAEYFLNQEGEGV